MEVRRRVGQQQAQQHLGQHAPAHRAEIFAVALHHRLALDEELACIWHPPGAAAVGAILVEPPAIREGWFELPERPGLGVRLAQDVPERYPFVEGHYAVEIER